MLEVTISTIIVTTTTTITTVPLRRATTILMSRPHGVAHRNYYITLQFTTGKAKET